jgi:hypothetical protein
LQIKKVVNPQGNRVNNLRLISMHNGLRMRWNLQTLLQAEALLYPQNTVTPIKPYHHPMSHPACLKTWKAALL